MTDDSSGGNISLEKLTRVYIKMREKKAEITHSMEQQVSEIEDGMKSVKNAILSLMKDMGAESIRTEVGTVYRTVRTVYSTNDWDSMNKFILEHEVPELLEKRLHQTNMKAFLEEHPNLLPPGLNSNAEYSVTIKRSKNG